MRDPACFNANCHATVVHNAKADQLLPHVKNCFSRGGIGLVSCMKCLEALGEGLKEKEVSIPPNTVCQLCAGVNGKGTIQFYANGEHALWICDTCANIQRSVISANFYMVQQLVPSKQSEEIFTFNLPKDPPKKRALPPPTLESRGFEPPPKRRMLRAPFAPSRTKQPWETTITSTLNQQEKIIAAIEELDVLQKQQAKNLRNIQSAVPSLLDMDTLRQGNDKLQEKVEKLTKNFKEAESQKAKIKELAEKLKDGSETLENCLDVLFELTQPIPEEKDDDTNNDDKVKEDDGNDDTSDDIIIKASDDSEDVPMITATAE